MDQLRSKFVNTIAEHKGLIYKVANAYCRDTEHRKDLIQEVILQLWLSYEKYDPKFQLSTWMYRIALNVAISYYRKERKHTDARLVSTDDILYLEDKEPVMPYQEELAQLQQFIRELKELDRAIIILYLEEKNQAEIGEILGLSTTNVSTRVGRIKEQLRQRFERIKSN